MLRPLITALALSFLIGTLPAEIEPKKFVYKEVDGQSLELYVFLPANQDAPTPGIAWYY